MAETMTVESIIEADWALQRFWVKTRFPFQTDNGGWSDIDVLAYKPEDRHLVISESKVRGPKKEVYAYTSYTRQEYGDILRYDGDNYFAFLRHLQTVCRDGLILRGFPSNVRKLTVQLVSNYLIPDDDEKEEEGVKADAIKTVEIAVARLCPPGLDIEVRLETTFDVICRIIQTENESNQGKRYGHPIIDLARELNRYMDPQIKYAGRDRESNDRLRDSLRQKLKRTLFREEHQ